MTKDNKLNSRNCDCDTCNFSMVVLYLGFFVVNSFVVLTANLLFPDYVVLGTEWINKYWAVIHSMGTLSLVNVLTTPCDGETKRMRSFIVNLITVWVMGRLADNLGMGVSSWIVVILLGLFLNAMQKKLLMSVKEMNE